MKQAVVRVTAALAVLVVGLGPASALEPPSSPGIDAVPPAWPRASTVTAEAYLLVDADTGQTLASLRPDEDRPVASTVKVLTAISVLERTDGATRITAGTEVTGFAADAAGVGLDPGETWAVEDLLEGLVARSGNDAANALAVGVGGTVDGFVDLMRADARALGLDVRLTTPTGLGDANRVSARDLVALTRVALADRRFADIAARPRVELPDLGVVESRNTLLTDYPGAFGVKTGYTATSGRCLIAAAARDGRRLIAVVLGSEGPTDHFADARALLDFGFGALRPVVVASEGPEVELRRAAGWIRLEAPDAQASAPTGGAPVELAVDLPVELDGAAGRLSARWQGSALVELDLRAIDEAVPPSRPGAWLAERVYAAMRAATDAELWTVAE